MRKYIREEEHKVNKDIIYKPDIDLQGIPVSLANSPFLSHGSKLLPTRRYIYKGAKLLCFCFCFASFLLEMQRKFMVVSLNSFYSFSPVAIAIMIYDKTEATDGPLLNYPRRE